MSRVRIEGVQGLRGLAALAVVWVHIISDLLPSGGGDLHDVGFYGNCGVDIFFVISGFIMVVSSAEGGFLPGKFMLKRIARVAPPYWLYTLLFFSAALVFPSLFSRFKPDWVQLVQTLLFIPGRDPPVIVVGWTLNLEMFFYACFAVAKSQTRHFVPLLGAMLALAEN